MFNFKTIMTGVLSAACMVSMLAGCGTTTESVTSSVSETSYEEIAEAESIRDLLEEVTVEGRNFFWVKDSIPDATVVYNEIELSESLNAYVYSSTAEFGDVGITVVDTYYEAADGHTLSENWEDEDTVLAEFILGRGAESIISDVSEAPQAVSETEDSSETGEAASVDSSETSEAEVSSETEPSSVEAEDSSEAASVDSAESAEFEIEETAEISEAASEIEGEPESSSEAVSVEASEAEGSEAEEASKESADLTLDDVDIQESGEYKYVLISSTMNDVPSIQVLAIRVNDDAVRVVTVEITDYDMVEEFIELLSY